MYSVFWVYKYFFPNYPPYLIHFKKNTVFPLTSFSTFHPPAVTIMRRHAVSDLSSAVSWKPSPPPLSHTLQHINKHTHRVPSPQSASAEVTRQVAANKALRGQLQEKEDKLRQLQDKLVSHLFLH